MHAIRRLFLLLASLLQTTSAHADDQGAPYREEKLRPALDRSLRGLLARGRAFSSRTTQAKPRLGSPVPSLRSMEIAMHKCPGRRTSKPFESRLLGEYASIKDAIPPAVVILVAIWIRQASSK